MGGHIRGKRVGGEGRGGDGEGRVGRRGRGGWEVNGRGLEGKGGRMLGIEGTVCGGESGVWR